MISAELFQNTMDNLAAKGCFLVTGDKKPNIMTIGWGQVGIMWQKPVFVVPVRLSRYSHQLMEEVGEFTVCVPSDTSCMSSELAVCGSKSGRDMDKAKELGLTLVPSKKVKVPNIEQCSMVYECVVRYKLEMTQANLDEGYVNRWYPDANYHTLYFGEIVDSYSR